MYPAQLLTVKHKILSSYLPDIIPLAHKIIKAEQTEKIYSLLMKLNN
jgi:phosphotransferase system enzyme I (PtsI)